MIFYIGQIGELKGEVVVASFKSLMAELISATNQRYTTDFSSLFSLVEKNSKSFQYFSLHKLGNFANFFIYLFQLCILDLGK